MTVPASPPLPAQYLQMLSDVIACQNVGQTCCVSVTASGWPSSHTQGLRMQAASYADKHNYAGDHQEKTADVQPTAHEPLRPSSTKVNTCEAHRTSCVSIAYKSPLRGTCADATGCSMGGHSWGPACLEQTALPLFWFSQHEMQHACHASNTNKIAMVVMLLKAAHSCCRCDCCCREHLLHQTQAVQKAKERARHHVSGHWHRKATMLYSSISHTMCMTRPVQEPFLWQELNCRVPATRVHHLPGARQMVQHSVQAPACRRIIHAMNLCMPHRQAGRQAATACMQDAASYLQGQHQCQ
jgi:hypothetical protein